MTNTDISNLLKNALAAQNVAAPQPVAPAYTAPVARRLSPAELILDNNGILAAWAIYQGAPDARFEERTIQDIIGRLANPRNGNISDRQVAFVRSLLVKIAGRAAQAAQRQATREAERASAADVVAGRREIEGVVLTTKLVQGHFGTTVKMLVQAADGSKVWGTVPAALTASYTRHGVERGDTVALVATVEPSKDDPKFGFFARPTNARIVARREVAA